MNNLGLPDPTVTDVAVPANLQVGLQGVAPEIEERILPANVALNKLEAGDTLFINLREQSEREKIDVIPGSIHVP